MENRLKERLTGAAILVALIVLVVPEMFHGPGRTAAPAGSVTAAPARFAAAPAAPAARGAAGASGASVASGASAVAGDAAAADTPPLQSYTIDLSPAGTPAAAAVAVHPAAAAAAAAAAHAAASAHGAVAVSAAARRTRPAAAAPTGWGVQLGLFARRENAQRLTRTARAKGFSVRMSSTGSKGLQRVWIAGLADRSAAEQMLRKLHAAGLPAAVLRPR